MDGEELTLTVEITGNPTPDIMWYHNGKVYNYPMY